MIRYNFLWYLSSLDSSHDYDEPEADLWQAEIQVMGPGQTPGEETKKGEDEATKQGMLQDVHIS